MAGARLTRRLGPPAAPRPRPAVTAIALLFGAAAALGAGPVQSPQGAAPGTPPNVVLIVADDAGYADFTAFGDPEMATPAIDSIAANGVRFTAAYNAASVCSPSRAGLLTGRYPQRFGHEFNIPRTPLPGASLDDIGLPLGETTMADALTARGYTAVAIGKWHLGLRPPYRPLQRGFTEFFGFLYGSRSYFPIEGDVAPGAVLQRNGEPQPERGYMTDVLAAETVRTIERLRNQAFFLYVNFNAVHTPMHAKSEHLDMFADEENERRQTLAAMTVSLDEAVGAILEALGAAGLEDNTLVWFVNDNGGATNNASINAPLRGQKGDKFEGGIRVPMMLQWPAQLPRGADYDLPVSSLDIFATSVAAAQRGASTAKATDGAPGAAPASAAQRDPAPLALDGVDLLPFLSGETPGRPHETLFWRRGAIAAVRHGDWKLIRVDGAPTWLFNLADDPYETANRFAEERTQAAELEALIGAWEADTVEPRWRTDPFWTQNQIDKHTPGRAQPPTVQTPQNYTPTAAGAPSTDIYLGRLAPSGATLTIVDVINITDREGYDNQPAFTPDGVLLYTSARNARQTDIYRYDLDTGSTRQVTQTIASEFSATPLPTGDGFSSIHEGPGVQALWRYGWDGADRGGILESVQPVGYHAWADDNTVVMFVLGDADNPATLQVGDVRAGVAEIVAENPGRSLHKVPGRRAVSFVRKIDNDNWWVEVIDFGSGSGTSTAAYTRLIRTLPGREDYAWMPDGILVMGDGSRLFISRPGGEWTEIADLAALGVRGITRLAVHPGGTHIAIVGNR